MRNEPKNDIQICNDEIGYNKTEGILAFINKMEYYLLQRKSD